MKCLFSILLLVFCSRLYAPTYAEASRDVSAGIQDEAIIDSLKIVIATADHDTTKIKALNQLAWKQRGENPDTSIILSTQALELSEKAQYERGIANSWHHLANFNSRKSNYDRALEYNHKALEIHEKQNDLKDMATSYGKIGIIYNIQSDYSRALEYYLKSLKIFEEINDKTQIAAAYNNIGGIYHQQSNYPLALQFFFKALKTKQEINDTINGHYANMLNNIGIIYKNQSDYPRALGYYFKSLKIREELGDKRGMAFSYGNIGIIYANQSDYPMALGYFLKSLKISEQLGDKKAMANSLIGIGVVFMYLFEYDTLPETIIEWVPEQSILLDSALYYQNKAFQISKELSDEYNMTYSLINIAKIHFKKRDYSHALEYFQHAAILTDNIGALKEESEAHQGLAECYEKLNNHKLALEHYKQYTTLKDSIFNEEKSKGIGKLEAKHEFETAEIERKRLEEEQAKQEREGTICSILAS